MPARNGPRGHRIGRGPSAWSARRSLATARQNATEGGFPALDDACSRAIQENLKCVLPTPDFCAIGPARAARRRAALFIRTTYWLNWPNTFGDAGWSSPVARQAHNLKVVSSNLAPATNLRHCDIERKRTAARRFCVFSGAFPGSSTASRLF